MGKCCQRIQYYLCCCRDGGQDNKAKRVTQRQTKRTEPKGGTGRDVGDNQVIEEKTNISEEKQRQEDKGSPGRETYKESLKERQTKGNAEEIEDLKIVKRFTKKFGFDLLTNCGSGEYSDVYKVYSHKNNRNYALKVINNAKIGDYYKINFLPNEIKISREMPRHPNLVRVFSVKQMYERVFVVMEFAAKGTLTDYLRNNGSMTEEIAKPFFKQILDGIHELHRINIAHRDIKLENILLSKKSNPMISDFGYAIEVDPKNPLSTQFCGTLPYLAPEILQRIPFNPLVSDIWSLGVCFFILLNDALPFKIEDDDSVMLKNQLKKNWSFRKSVEPKLSVEVKNIIKSMLEPNPTLRPKTRDLKVNPWFRQ